ncbi:sulfatase-like hydrolase/transferase [[Ruminococcus] lactaris]|uniref:sulfatase-like hydrolase/transferase n=1 Tax=[Ruminococcus] lactaris TaxID=46228 RepID=UPI001D03BB5F|nr:sulfatase-like hydrolase/transferase [[Ruminococcus] lactaris]MCB5537824.1 sulfatase-like hydrolase/transferase [[Ruminococcus] lactaris]MCB5551763.1 sulfatase-like hydrolase/transferase [[Ruminococcus] lactaris]MCB5736768.1 sulfatase-like hydrolase/transferase [[Ruminococcus] lactaris]MCB5829934.1 sulfatase-like hydrolase/transferase [[Ruminococcus] lactaris]MCB5844870.1 sulfatase-like hydrolase/transferase [[Ruminococcus] lactaris]
MGEKQPSKWKEILLKILYWVGEILTVFIAGLSVLLALSVRWMFATWTNLSMDELVYHLTAPLDGTNTDMIWDYVRVCAAPTILVIFFLILILIAWRKKEKVHLFRGIINLVALVGIIVMLGYTWTELGVGDYLKDQNTESKFIEDEYVDPTDVEVVFPEQKRNLIYIFLESMETTYSDVDDGGAFDENVIPELTEIAQTNEDFSGADPKLNGGYSLAGTTWTMGAMFAQTSGLPLNISISANDMDTQDSFFPGVTTLGDILSDAGYTQTLVIGSEAQFGGRKLYFQEHGNYEMEDYSYAIENGLIPSDYKVWWGYEDQKLFEFAKEKLLQLSQGDEPFNLTMLTVDTHFEDGYVCEQCPTEYDTQYSNVMACSSRQVGEFLKWIQQQDFYENTTIVISGDHPTMDSDYCAEIDQEGNYDRRVFTAYINAAAYAQDQQERTYSTFDNFPTTLAALGVQIDGDRLGLGTNLFSGTKTLLEEFGNSKVNAELKKKSEFIEKLSAMDKTNDALLIREGKMNGADADIDMTHVAEGYIPVAVTNVSDSIVNNLQGLVLTVWTEDGQADVTWYELNPDEEGNYAGVIDLSRFNYKPGTYYVNVRAVEQSKREYDINCMEINVP